MKKRLALLALVVVVALAGVMGHSARAVPLASSCSDWGNQTTKRVDQARLLLEPKELGGQTTGSAQGDAQALRQLAQDQAGTNPPKSGQKLNGDLLEAFSAGANALAGTGAADAQITLAKAIVYNADLRLAYLLDHC